jgi:hypothetical protein
MSFFARQRHLFCLLAPARSTVCPVHMGDGFGFQPEQQDSDVGRLQAPQIRTVLNQAVIALAGFHEVIAVVCRLSTQCGNQQTPES